LVKVGGKKKKGLRPASKFRCAAKRKIKKAQSAFCGERGGWVRLDEPCGGPAAPALDWKGKKPPDPTLARRGARLLA